MKGQKAQNLYEEVLSNPGSDAFEKFGRGLTITQKELSELP